jgi:DNA-binding XRE family transcriptional regulator
VTDDDPPIDRETANVLRDVLDLPERERLRVINEARDDLAEGGRQLPGQRVVEQMDNAIETFDQVAAHLGLDDDLAKLVMKMKTFDAVPYRVRDGLKARQLARVFGSWHLVKQAAVGEKLQTTPSQKRRRERFVKERRRSRRIEEGLNEWLATDPEKATMSAYNSWREKQNASLEPGELQFLASTSITTMWKRGWRELVADAKSGTLKPPLIEANDPFASERSVEADTEPGVDLDLETAAPADLDFDPDLIARRVREARTARKMSMNQLASRTDVSAHSIMNLESGKQGQRIYLRSVLRLARALDVPIDFFVTPDGKRGLPPRSTLKQG